MKMARLITLCAVLLLAAPVSSAHSDPCLERTLPVSVTRWDGAPVANVSAENLAASIHHKPVRIISVEPHQTPSRIFLVIDDSGSMAATADVWRSYMEVADWIMARIPSGASVGLVVFGRKIQSFTPPNQDPTRTKVELKRLAAHEKPTYPGTGDFGLGCSRYRPRKYGPTCGGGRHLPPHGWR